MCHCKWWPRQPRLPSASPLGIFTPLLPQEKREGECRKGTALKHAQWSPRPLGGSSKTCTFTSLSAHIDCPTAHDAVSRTLQMGNESPLQEKAQSGSGRCLNSITCREGKRGRCHLADGGEANTLCPDTLHSTLSGSHISATCSLHTALPESIQRGTHSQASAAQTTLKKSAFFANDFLRHFACTSHDGKRAHF